MAKKSKDSKLSRRAFISNVGAGLAGSYLATLPLSATETEKRKRDKNSDDRVSLTINGEAHVFEVKASTTLAELLRDKLLLKGTKIACNHGECGACTVLLNGHAVYSCHFLALDADGMAVTTIEGISSGDTPHPLQKSFVENDGLQCGFCTSGQIMSAYALLQKNKKPTDPEIIEAMSGNICRCGAYPNILKSVKAAISMEKEGGA